MNRLPRCLTALLIMLTVLSCSESRSPIEAERAVHEQSAQLFEHGMTGSFPPFSDDFESGLDPNVWKLETVNGAIWTHTTEGENGYIYCPGQNPYDRHNRNTDIISEEDEFSDFIMTWDMRFHTDGWHKAPRYMYFRCDDNWPNIYGYRIGTWVNNPPDPPHYYIMIIKITPSETVILVPELYYPWELGTWYSFRLRADGNIFKLKVWKKQEPEPTSWTIETMDEDSSFSSGSIGFGNYWGAITDVDNVIVNPFIHTVHLDIKPRSCPNPLNAALFDNEMPNNPKSMKDGVLPVAILGTDDFDVHDIDISTIELEGATPLRHSYEDVATPVLNGEECECTTVGPDGCMDLTLKFKKWDIVSALVSVVVGDVIPLEISGMLLDGTPFEGEDCVLIVGKEQEPELAPL
ncbi:MAG: hypothetical protein JSV33_02025 [bacterium]|nr:MAG: hypothetical protein JSV33_02025 [bacterium]